MGDVKQDAATYQARLTRVQCRNLLDIVESVRPTNKGHNIRVSTAASELFEPALAKSNENGIEYPEWKDGEAKEVVDVEFSGLGLLGVKHAIVARLLGKFGFIAAANLVERKVFMSIAAKIGPERKLLAAVEREAKLPDAEDLDEKKELADIFGLEAQKAKTEEASL